MLTRPPAAPIGAPAQVHDVQLDYYGRRLATCSSDRTIKVRPKPQLCCPPGHLLVSLSVYASRRSVVFIQVTAEVAPTSARLPAKDVLTAACAFPPIFTPQRKRQLGDCVLWPAQVFDVASEQVAPLADLTGHEGPVWQVLCPVVMLAQQPLAATFKNVPVAPTTKSQRQLKCNPVRWGGGAQGPPASAAVLVLAAPPLRPCGLVLAAVQGDLPIHCVSEALF